MNLNELTTEEKDALRPLLHKVLALIDTKSATGTPCSDCINLEADRMCSVYQASIPDDWFDKGCEHFLDDIPF